MPQRSRGGSTASGIERRGSAQFRAKIRRKGVDEAKTFETEAEAKRWLEIKRGEVAGDTHEDRSREKETTLRDVLTRYLSEVTPEKKGARAERPRLLAWVREPWAALPLISISPAHVTAWRDARVTAGKAPTTIGNAMNLLSHVFKIARAEWGYRVENPVAGIRRPKQRAARNAVPDDTFETALVNEARASKGPWLAPMIQLASWTAMRQGEIQTLRWENVDFDKHLIYIPESKNGVARHVPMLDQVVRDLCAWVTEQNSQGSGWVFPSPLDHKKPLAEGSVTVLFARIVKKVIDTNPGFERITFHDLRHWGCTRLAGLHVDALDLAKTTGHKTLQVLMRYYNPDPIARVKRIRAADARTRLGSQAGEASVSAWVSPEALAQIEATLAEHESPEDFIAQAVKQEIARRATIAMPAAPMVS